MHNSFAKKKILLIGVGGIGTVVADLLSHFRNFELVLIDFDKVEITNLNRQFLFEKSDIGKFKVKVIKRADPRLTKRETSSKKQIDPNINRKVQNSRKKHQFSVRFRRDHFGSGQSQHPLLRQ